MLRMCVSPVWSHFWRQVGDRSRWGYSLDSGRTRLLMGNVLALQQGAGGGLLRWDGSRWSDTVGRSGGIVGVALDSCVRWAVETLPGCYQYTGQNCTISG